MAKICMILTCEYPYITAEPFLENEIPYLKECFDRILIFPFNAAKDAKATRVLPENAEAFPMGCIWSKLRYPVYMLRGLFSREKKLKITEKRLKRTAVSLYERGRSDYVFSQIVSLLEQAELPLEDVTVYSYWFTDQAIVAWRLAQYLRSRGCRVKAVSRGHRYDIYEKENQAGYLPYQAQSLEYLEGVYICSRDGRDHIRTRFPQYREKVQTAYLGTVDHGLQEYGNGTETVFVTCSSLKPFKRVALFAEAFCKLCKSHPQLPLRWVCIGDGAEEETVHQIVEQAELSSQVTFTGRMTNREVLEYYKAHPVSYFCNVSTSEGLPVSIMEAMSFGIPAIATDVGGTGELVCEDNGRLLPVELDAAALAEQLAQCACLEGEAYRSKRRNARAAWEAQASAEKNFTAWCDLLTQ